MIDKGSIFCRNVFVIIFGASGPGVRSIQKVAQWDTDFSCVGIVKQSDINLCGMYRTGFTDFHKHIRFFHKRTLFNIDLCLLFPETLTI